MIFIYYAYDKFKMENVLSTFGFTNFENPKTFELFFYFEKSESRNKVL